MNSYSALFFNQLYLTCQAEGTRNTGTSANPFPLCTIGQSFFKLKMFFKKKQKQFQEADNTAVFTTKYVTLDKKPITYVTHEVEDGAWQFFSSDEFENYEEVAMIVGLGEVVRLDPSLLELADMPVGHYAFRETVNDRWSIRQQVNP